jgi:hypothetical protein
LNKTNKTVTVATSHFSDWALFESFRLDVEKSLLRTGEATALKVIGIRLLGGVSLPEAGIYEDTTIERVSNWQLNGQGILNPDGSRARFTAPLMEPTPNPVSVSVEVTDIPTREGTKAKVILFASIFVHDEYMKVTFGNANHYYKDVDASVSGGVIIINGGIPGAQAVNLNFGSSGTGTKSFDVKPLTPTNVTAAIGSTPYVSWYQKCNPPEMLTTGGSITISSVGPVGGYIEGSFGGTLAYGPGPCDDPGFQSISGSFRIKRRF